MQSSFVILAVLVATIALAFGGLDRAKIDRLTGLKGKLDFTGAA